MAFGGGGRVGECVNHRMLILLWACTHPHTLYSMLATSTGTARHNSCGADHGLLLATYCAGTLETHLLNLKKDCMSAFDTAMGQLSTGVPPAQVRVMFDMEATASTATVMRAVDMAGPQAPSNGGSGAALISSRHAADAARTHSKSSTHIMFKHATSRAVHTCAWVCVCM